MATPVTKDVKRTKDEVWLEKRFSLKLEKVDPELLESGKKQSEFRSNLGIVRITFEMIEKRFSEVKKLKIDPNDKTKVRVFASLPKDFKAIETMMKKLVFKTTPGFKVMLKAFREWNGDLGSLTMKQGMNASGELDHRDFAGGSNR